MTDEAPKDFNRNGARLVSENIEDYTGPSPTDADGNLTEEFLAASRKGFQDALKDATERNATFGFVVCIEPEVDPVTGKIPENHSFRTRVLTGMANANQLVRVTKEIWQTFKAMKYGVPLETIQKADDLIQKLGERAAVSLTLKKLMDNAMKGLGSEAEGEGLKVEEVQTAEAMLKN